MEFSRFVVIGAGLQHYPQSDQRILFVDTIVMERCTPPLNSVVYQLKDLVGFYGHPRGKESLILLGPIISICRQSRSICLMDQTVIKYKKLVTFSGARQDHRYGDWQDSLSPSALQAIFDAIRLEEIRLAVSQVRCGNLTLPNTTTVLDGSMQLYEKCRKEIKSATQTPLHTLGSRIAVNRLYQVHT